MVSMIILATLGPIFILLIGAMLILFMQDRINRKLFNSFILFLALFINTSLAVVYWMYEIVERTYYLNLEFGSILVIEIILALSLIVSLFSKEENEHVDNENLFDGIVIIIIIGLIGMVITSNLVAICSCFILVLLMIGVLFYFGDYPKEFQILRLYFFSVVISVILIVISLYLIYLEFNTLILTEINELQISKNSNTIISVILLLALGIPCGLFPFSIYHLKNYYQDSSYTNLFLYSIFSITTVFLLTRILNLFTFRLVSNGLIILIIVSIGLIISLVFMLTELFSSLDGATFSIKKIFGYSLTADFNMFLLFLSLVALLPENLSGTYINTIIFYYLMIVIVKSLIFSSFFPVMLETHDDNIKLLGEFWLKYKGFGVILFLSGIILSLPLNLFALQSISNVFTSSGLDNSLLSMLNTIIFTLYVIYIAITLTFISIIFIQIYFSDKPRYIVREPIKSINGNHYVPIIVLFILIGVLMLLFISGNQFYYETFGTFFLILEN